MKARNSKRSWFRSRAAIVIGVVVFLVLAGTGAATAVWTANGGSLSATTTPGDLSITQTGFTSLANVYSSSNLTDTAPLSITNAGTVPASYTMVVQATSANNLANATTIAAWIVSAASACTSATATGTGLTATAGTGINATVSIPVGDTDVYCVRTSITSSYAAANSTGSDTLRATLTSSLGNWSSNSTADAAQSLADSTAPTVPTNLTATAPTTTTAVLTWTASTDAIGVTGYRIYRNGTLITTTGKVLTYTNTGLTKGTTYSYTISAIDAAGNASAQTAAVSVTTPLVDTGVKYRLLNANSGLCIDAGSGTPASGADLQIYACSTARAQNWMFVKASTGYYGVVPSTATSIGWDVDGASTSTYSGVGLYTYSSGTNEQWKPVADTATTMHFVNLNSGLCLWVSGNSKSSGTALVQYTCNGSVGETFTYTVVS